MLLQNVLHNEPLVEIVAGQLRGGVREDANHVGAVALPKAEEALLAHDFKARLSDARVGPGLGSAAGHILDL